MINKVRYFVTKEMLSIAKGKSLDKFGDFYTLKRIKYFWIFKESDKKFRKRILNTLKERLDV